MKGGSNPKRLGGWRGSAAQIAIGRAAIRAWNARRHLAPKCTATSKTTGMQCRQVAMDNGKCAYHGGLTPKGDGKWHRPRWPNRGAPKAMAKLDHKLRDLKRAAAKRAVRLRRMSPEQREAYDKWQCTHEATSAGDRKRKREELRQARETRARIREWELRDAIECKIGVFG